MAQYARKSKRYELRLPVDVSYETRRMAFGTLVDISKDGLAFRSRQSLMIGTTYTVTIKDLGSLSCRILNHSDIDRYGGVFLDSERRKQRLEAQFLALAKVQ